MIKSCNAKKIKNIQLIRWLIQLLSIMNWSFEDILNEICKWTRHNWWIPIEELDHYKSNGESLWYFFLCIYIIYIYIYNIYIYI
jgi:hypothetical protein